MIRGLSSLDFAAPQWFALTLVLPFLAILKWWSGQRARKAIDAVVARRLQKDLVRRGSVFSEWTVFALQLLAVAAFILALARPQWGFREVESFSEGRNVMIAIDTSNSMLAEDVNPNRLTRAKMAAQDLVRNLPDDRIGLIAFSGLAFVQAPLTIDHDAVLESIDQLDTEVIPRGGTNVCTPAILTLDTMAETETSLAALILFSDGEDHESGPMMEEVRRRAAQTKLLIVTVGVGTTNGSIIPDPMAKRAKKDGVFIQDSKGDIVRSRLEPAALQTLSDITGGVYVPMGSSASVAEVVQQTLRKLESQRLQVESRRVPLERYQIPLIAGMMLLVLSYLWPMNHSSTAKRNVAATAKAAKSAVTAILIVGAMAWNPRAEAATDEARFSYEHGKFDQALTRYRSALDRAKKGPERAEVAFGLGAAAYRVKDYETAAYGFGESLLHGNLKAQEEAHYNLGNTLYETGRAKVDDAKAVNQSWTDAIAHYDAAIALNPAHQRAIDNREHVKRMMQAYEEEQKQKPEEQEKEPDDKEKEENSQPQQNPPDPPKQDPPPDQPKDQNPQQPPPPKPDENPPPPEQEPPQPPKQNDPLDKDFTKEEARKLLENNADEARDVRPMKASPLPPSSQPFKNW